MEPDRLNDEQNPESRRVGREPRKQRVPLGFEAAKARGETLPAAPTPNLQPSSAIPKRAISFAVEGSYSEEWSIEMIGALTGGRCIYCGLRVLRQTDAGLWELRDDVRIERDHLIPVFHIGLTTNGNYYHVCRGCNQEKRAQNLYSFQQSLLDRGEAYLTAEGFRELTGELLQPYREGRFAELYELSHGWMETGASDEEMRPHIPLFFSHGAGTPEGYSIMVRSSDSPRSESDSAEYYDGLREHFGSMPGPSNRFNGQRNAVLRLQLLTDELYRAGDFSDPEPVTLTDFQALAERALRENSAEVEDRSTATVKEAHSKLNAVLRLIAQRSDDREWISYAEQIPGFAEYTALEGKPFRTLSADDLDALESIHRAARLQAECWSKTTEKSILAKGKNFRLHVRSALPQGTALRELTELQRNRIGESFISSYTEGSEDAYAAKIYAGTFVLKEHSWDRS